MFQQLANAASAALRLAGEIDWVVKQVPAIAGTNAPVADASSAQLGQQLSPAACGRIEFGVIFDAIPQLQAYRVLPEGTDAVILCTRLRSGSVTPFGVADADTLAVGTPVYYIRHPKADEGLIIGAEAGALQDPRLLSADAIVQGSNVGMQSEVGLQEVFRFGAAGTNSGIVDRSGRTPMDSLPLGDFCRVAETGVMLALDSYMASMRVDEMCGLFMYYWDQLLRLAGLNFQRWTGGSVLESYDDEGEHFWYHGIAGYPWEQCGSLAYGTPYAESVTALITQIVAPWRQSVDLSAMDSIPFHRLQEFAGYVGQGFKRLMVAPPVGISQYTLADLTPAPGVFEENVTFSGHYAVRSASGLSICKRPVIPVPKRTKLHADSDGDKPENYKSSGVFGAGDNTGVEHQVQPTPTLQTEQNTNMSRAAGVNDMLAHVFNWEAANGLAYHQKDYHYPDEADDSTIQFNQKPIDYNQLRNQWSLDPPQPVEVKVDNRNDGKNTVKVFPNNSYLTLLDDGGIVIGDGYGSEIVMTGGNIRITTPGDIFFEAGRSVHNWAGNDFTVRAKQSADITCTLGDFRAKAEKNLQLIGGNGGGAHGILLDCRGTRDTFDFTDPGEKTEHSGIVLRSISAPIVNWGSSIYHRSLDGGNIVLDASRGDGELISHSSFAIRYLQYGAIDAFGAEGKPDSTNYWLSEIAGIAGTICTGGGIWSHGSHVIEGSFYAIGGHIATEMAQSEEYQHVSPLEENALEQLRQGMSNCDDNGSTVKDFATTTYTSDMTAAWYAQGKAGNDAIIEAGMASLRDDGDYAIEGFVLYETRWAREARGNELTLTRWEEQPVMFGSTPTYPFPGKTKFTDACYYQQPASLYDPKTGLSKPRLEDSTFTDPMYGQPQPSVLNENYPIIGRGVSDD